MNIVIDNYDFGEMDAMRYYSYPASWSNDKRKTDLHEKIYSGEWLGSEKKDGYFAKVIKDCDGNAHLYSRSRNVNGEYTDKIEWVPQFARFINSIPNGTVILCEVYLPNAPGSNNVTSILGCLKDEAIEKQKKNPLYLYVFDILAYNNKSLVEKQAVERFAVLNELGNDEYVSLAYYSRGETLWNRIQSILGNGGEGVVITKQYAIYKPGKRPSKTTLKVKKELRDTIDCFFTGQITLPERLYSGKEISSWNYWENTNTNELLFGEHYNEYTLGEPIEPVTKSYFYGYAGSLEIGVLTDNKCIESIGYLSNLSEDIKRNYHEYKNRVIEVNAMELSFDKNHITLRHGKMVGFRDDLTIEDCTLSKITKEIKNEELYCT